MIFNEQAYEETCRRASRFVLVATVPPEYRDAEEILRLYKGQIQIEMNFSFLKDPYFVDEVYFKKPNRVEVLGYIFLTRFTCLQSIPTPYSSTCDR